MPLTTSAGHTEPSPLPSARVPGEGEMPSLPKPKSIPEDRMNLRTLLRRGTILSTAIALAGAAAVSAPAPTPPPPAAPLTAQQSEFFENKIRPIFVKNCYKCHSVEQNKAK